MKNSKAMSFLRMQAVDRRKLFLLSIFFFSLCRIMGQSAQNRALSLQDMEGKWFIHLSDFPFWLKGDKLHPTLNYAVVKKGKHIGLSDKVLYMKDGKEKSIMGFDKVVNSDTTEFVWRGKGLLGVLRSRWRILHFDFEGRWAILSFEKTLFTPSGFDVISKDRVLSAEVMGSILQKLEELGITHTLSIIAQP